jgi:hypothetical protein
MRKFSVLLALAAGLVISAAAARAPGGNRVTEILPAEGLIESSVVTLRDQAALNTHYYLADETVLGLGKRTDAVFARYRTGGRDALVLAVAYPSEEEAGKVYGRFGRDFFSKKFDPKKIRFLERIETGDYAAALRTGSFLIVVLEAPDVKSCDGLLRRIEEKALALR